MNVLRTPDSAFENLPDYPFSPHYCNVGDASTGELRMHYVDEGSRQGEIVLMLHGEPSWSYLYRKMITPIAKAGYRVIAPDLIGFGRSDKPAEQDDYTYASHLTWLERFITQTQLNNLTLVCQDWGGLLGLRLVGDHPDWFARVLAANTFLPTGDKTPPDAFFEWRDYSQQVPEFPTASIIQRGTTQPIPDAIMLAYDAPFPDEGYKAGARKFPTLVPVTPDNVESHNNRQAWAGLKSFTKPFLTAFSDSDPITAGGEKVMQALIPGCQNQAHTIIKNGGHFLQEDKGEELAQVLLAFMQSN